MIGLSRMLPTMPLSSPITSSSKQRTFSSSREMSKLSPLSLHENLPVSSSKFLVPSSWRRIMKRQRKHRSELPRTPRSILQRGGVLPVKYDSTKNKRVRQSALRASARKEFVPLS